MMTGNNIHTQQTPDISHYIYTAHTYIHIHKHICLVVCNELKSDIYTVYRGNVKYVIIPIRWYQRSSDQEMVTLLT